jgi:hypothetical protein
MKREDRIYRYRGEWGERSHCRFRLYEQPAQTVVIATELPDNPGTSVTTFAEYLATMICTQYELLPERLRWIEHHPGRGAHGRRVESFDLVTFTFRSDPPPWLSHVSWNLAYRQRPSLFHFTDPRWQRITREEVEALIGERLGD